MPNKLTKQKSFNDRFYPTNGSHISSFFRDEYQNYAVYKVLQRLPNILDTLAQTQRKLITVLEKRPQSRKIKTAETYGMIYNETKYLHGDASAFTTSESMSRGSSNNINIFTEEGNFGFRTNRAAAGPRYTNTRFSKSARLLFREEDKGILNEQEFEGTKIEPPFLLPILPVMLMNGQEAIAVGYASKFLPRNPIILIDTMITMLSRVKKTTGGFKNMRPSSIPVHFPYFKGHQIQTFPNGISTWYLTGILLKSKKKNIIEILEVPPSFTRESYIKKLKKFLEKGIIKSYKEECVKNTFYFEVKLDPSHWSKSEEELIKLLGLHETTVENFTFISPDEAQPVIKFKTAEDYLKIFLEQRQYWYNIRKQSKLIELKLEIDILLNRIRFIEEINNNNIIITKRKKSALEQELKEKKFLLVDSSFDYLIGIRLYNLTEEMQSKLKIVIKSKEDEYNLMDKTTIESMHISELREFKKNIQSELKKKEAA